MNDVFGIPTVYRSRRFRSRLEARWAAFFDQLGWRWEYEPVEFDGWIPDFMICGKEDKVLVEVKPISKYTDAVEVMEKIERALNWPDVYDSEEEVHPNYVHGYEALILGIHPFDGQNDPGVAEIGGGEIILGWLHDGSQWAEAAMGRWTSDLCGNDAAARVNKQIGFCHTMGSFSDRITGYYAGGCHGDVPLKFDEIDRIWARAVNATQWRAS